MILTYIIVYVLWILYSCVEGCREGLYYDIASKEGNGIKELHKMYTGQRALVVMSIMFLVARQDGLYSLIYFFSFVLSFSFWHDGFYYITRNKLDSGIYKERFKAESTTSTAKIELDYFTRMCMFVFGFVLFILFLLYVGR